MSSDIVYLHKTNVQKGVKSNTDKIEITSTYDNKPNRDKFFQHFSHIKIDHNNYKKFRERDIDEIVPFNIDELQLSAQSAYSSATNEDSIITANYIYDYYQFIVNNFRPNPVILTDACANVGCNTINFALKFDIVNAIELLPDEYQRLVNNIDVYGFNNVAIFNDDAMKLIYEKPKQLNNNIIFFDPPWGGSDYIKYDNLGLSLTDDDITEDITRILDTNLAQMVVLKGPFNTYIKNKTYYQSQLVFTTENIEYTKGEMSHFKSKNLFHLFFFHKPGNNVTDYLSSLKDYTELLSYNKSYSVSYSTDLEKSIPVRNVFIAEITKDNLEVPVSLIYNLNNVHYEPVIKYTEQLNSENIKSIQSNIKYHDYDIDTMIKYSVSNDSQFINREITRQEVYENIIKEAEEFINKNVISLDHQEVVKLINNYIFCKIISRKKFEDPVIMSENSDYANRKLAYDLKYIENQKRIVIDKKIKSQTIEKLQELFYINSTILTTQNIISDGIVDYIEDQKKFIYRYTYPNIQSEDYVEETIDIEIPEVIFKKLGETILTHKYNYVATYLRYQYLDLKSIALAFDYAKNEITRRFKKNETLECFASVFNFYYDFWCSAFNDVEDVFGSVGSFWDLSLKFFMRFVNLVINPPFDQVIIEETIVRINNIIDFSKKYKNNLVNVVVILPDWSDIRAIKSFKQLHSFVQIPKNQTYFIDYFQNQKIVQPCDILVFNIKLK